MAIAYVWRQWLAPGGWDGPRWSGVRVARFEKLMLRHAASRGRKPVKGVPALVSAWDDGRSALCWYVARRGPEERDLRRRCVAIFGRAPTPDAQVGGDAVGANRWAATRV